MTSEGRFVDREEGKKIAFNVGQSSEETIIATRLTSEDLWRGSIDPEDPGGSAPLIFPEDYDYWQQLQKMKDLKWEKTQ